MGEMIKDSLYYAKILLFGEYGIIENSMGLSIPYHFFKGNFDFASEPNEVQKDSNESIKEFVSHLVGSFFSNPLSILSRLKMRVIIKLIIG